MNYEYIRNFFAFSNVYCNFFYFKIYCQKHLQLIIINYYFMTSYNAVSVICIFIYLLWN